ncbi:hypothetical protein GCM10008940_07560 [Microbulbifer agarilyticus]
MHTKTGRNQHLTAPSNHSQGTSDEALLRIIGLVSCLVRQYFATQRTSFGLRPGLRTSMAQLLNSYPIVIE